MSKGNVKWFNEKKGYGFIVPDSGEKDVFVHISQVEKLGLSNLSDGQAIGFETYSDRDGRTAAGNLQLF